MAALMSSHSVWIALRRLRLMLWMVCVSAGPLIGTIAAIQVAPRRMIAARLRDTFFVEFIQLDEILREQYRCDDREERVCETI